MLSGTVTTVFKSAISLLMVRGIIMPTVSGTFILSVPAFSAARQTRFRKGNSDLVASIGENSHTKPCFLMYSVDSTVAESTCSGVRLTAYFICTGEVGMKK